MKYEVNSPQNTTASAVNCSFCTLLWQSAILYICPGLCCKTHDLSVASLVLGETVQHTLASHCNIYFDLEKCIDNAYTCTCQKWWAALIGDIIGGVYDDSAEWSCICNCVTLRQTLMEILINICRMNTQNSTQQLSTIFDLNENTPRMEPAELALMAQTGMIVGVLVPRFQILGRIKQIAGEREKSSTSKDSSVVSSVDSVAPRRSPWLCSLRHRCYD